MIGEYDGNNPAEFSYPYYSVKQDDGSIIWYFKPSEEERRWSISMMKYYFRNEIKNGDLTHQKFLKYLEDNFDSL